jgi:transposase-like protein
MQLPGERTDERQGYRNGSYQRQLTTRVGRLELEVPRDREGTFQTALFQRYQRS